MSSNTYQLVTLWQWTYFKHELPLNRFNSSTGFGAKKLQREGDREGEKNLVIVVSETRARKVGNLIGQTRSSSGSIGSSCTSGSAVADVCRFSRVLVIFLGPGWPQKQQNRVTLRSYKLVVCLLRDSCCCCCCRRILAKEWQKFLWKRIPFLFAFLASG